MLQHVGDIAALWVLQTRCRSIATFSSELRHKYNVRFIPIRKDDEAQVDCNLLLCCLEL